MYPDRLDVIIVGGSLAGLWTGIVLKTLPNISSITILERCQVGQLQDLGAGIRTNQESIDALLKYTGTPPEKYGALINAYRFIDIKGEVYFNLPTSTYTTTWGQLYRAFRQTFDTDSKYKYRLGCRLEGLRERDASSVQVEFQNEKGEQEMAMAHVVIGADGASSKVQSLMVPAMRRVSAGYVGYRGITPVSELSECTRQLYDHCAIFFRAGDFEFVSYNVPGNEAPADEASIGINWIWYLNKTEKELQQLLTDKQGKHHRFSLPAGGMRDEEILKLRARAQVDLPPQVCEVVSKTKEPFIQVCTDSLAWANRFLEGKVLLVGDAVGGQRPHAASAFLQATFHGLLVAKLLSGSIDGERWAEETQGVSAILVETGKELGKVLMGTELSPLEKDSAFMKHFIHAQTQLNSKWKELIGIGNASVKV